MVAIWNGHFYYRSCKDFVSCLSANLTYVHKKEGVIKLFNGVELKDLGERYFKLYTIPIQPFDAWEVTKGPIFECDGLKWQFIN